MNDEENAPTGPLKKAQQTGNEAADVGFDWTGPSGPLSKIDEELQELRDVLSTSEPVCTDRAREEIGDLLFSVVNLARHLEVNAAEALEESTAKFNRRLQRVLRLADARGEAPDQMELEALEQLWQQVKSNESDS